MNSQALVRDYRDGFREGLTWITRDQGLEFGIQKLAAGQTLTEQYAEEAAWVLLNGQVKFQWENGEAVGQRRSLFDENPTVLHVPAGTKVKISALGEDVELALAKTENDAPFETKVFTTKEVSTEFRGKGLVQDACLRQVKQVFDKKTRPYSNLVLGEVVNYPGRWSSYPPHHHAQPEIYHYRFTHKQGYGHAELGEEVYKIRNHDTIQIAGGLDHSQVSAPGYGMYYLWIVRHLPQNPYLGFEFTEEHKWLLDPKNQGWAPISGERK
jgi:5-deoxy-glucuronate isomerase